MRCLIESGDEIKPGKGRASVGSGGPWKIEHARTEPGDDSPRHIIWLPKGYGPCEGQFVVALVATPFENYELDKQLAQAVARTIEEFMWAANRRNRQIKERGWRSPTTPSKSLDPLPLHVPLHRRLWLWLRNNI